jgi:uncharacterized protein (DUF2132 family)
MHQPHHPNPLHGVKLETIVTALVDNYWREELGNIIRINCFRMNPSIKSSLTFLRKTEWARKEVEELYIWNIENGHISSTAQ